MRRTVILPASVCPPALPEPSRPPAWVLVDTKAYIAKRENATTARGSTSGGDVVVEVSFCLAGPPGFSYACVHCPGLEGLPGRGFFCEPIVAAAEGAFVLLETCFNFGPTAFSYTGGIPDYFVYKAGPGKPSLRHLPNPFPRDINPWEFGISSVAGGGFVVATLVLDLDADVESRPPLDLHVFSSRTGEWRTVVPRLDPSCHKVLSHVTSKVVVIGGGVLGWVDLWRGILLCDVLADDPVVRLAPLPKQAVARAWKSNPRVVRDVTGDGNNQLSFVEMQFPRRPADDLPPSYFDASISDSDSDSDTAAEPCYVSHGWRATAWKRTLFCPCPDDEWRKDCTVLSADILGADDPACFHLLPRLWDDAEAGKITKLLDTSSPILSVLDDGVVYMMSELRYTNNGREAWVAAFDLRRSRLKSVAPFMSKRISSFGKHCVPCSFSKYLGLGVVPAGQI